ncbi:MAG: NAD-dependent deacylase [Rhodocyclaceae bacterium]|nr:NAD-dependent deacylase [Rhodocyclaceae bacterium]MDZ4216214.1 NAD-dependent deacylase [Rhodocyclaceae bacterium]
MIPGPLRQHLRACRNIVVFTGAGISAESGIPTFRDRFEGLWAKYDPQEVATPQAFRANPQLVWDWHVYLADAIRQARPNAGHVAVARLAELAPRLIVITQNIDNLHQVAGSRDVLELHGNLFRLTAFVDADDLFVGDRSPIICPICDGYALDEECDHYASKEDLAAIELKAGPVPRCPGCRALLRPDIVWFGEPLAVDVLDAAWSATDTCDLLICIGSSLEVQPAASIPMRAKRNGASIIEINPKPTTLSLHADAFLQGKAAEVLPELIDEVWGSVL